MSTPPARWASAIVVGATTVNAASLAFPCTVAAADRTTVSAGRSPESTWIVNKPVAFFVTETGFPTGMPVPVTTMPTTSPVVLGRPLTTAPVIVPLMSPAGSDSVTAVPGTVAAFAKVIVFWAASIDTIVLPNAGSVSIAVLMAAASAVASTGTMAVPSVST